MSFSRPIRARIDAGALRHNHAIVRRYAAGSKIWSVVKANAYGHGIWRAVEALRHDADGFALLEPESGVALRESGVTQPLLLLEGLFAARDVKLAASSDLTVVAHCLEQLDLLQAEWPSGKPLRLYLKFNSGMNRLGFSGADLPHVWSSARELPCSEITCMTHFAEADDTRGVDWQLQRFNQQIAPWQGAVSLANSAAILRHAGAHGDWVRPGIMLYGASPFADEPASKFGLRPVMTLESRIIGIQHIGAGESVGYGGLFVAERPTRVGVVACGYADGYPRHAPTGTPIAVCNIKTRTLGRVSMDLLACDLTDIPEAGLGAPVTLWGNGQGGEIPADDVAAAAGTVAYELFCALAARVPVEVVGHE